MGKASRLRMTGLTEEERAVRAREKQAEEARERVRVLNQLLKALAGS